MSIKEFFRHFSHLAAEKVGTVWAFGLAIGSIVVWVVTGPFFHYSDTWQLIINTATTIVTFLMVFLIQNAQNRDSRAVHLKLDELIRSTAAARNELMDLENLDEDELEKLQAEFRSMQSQVSCELNERKEERTQKQSKIPAKQ